MKMLEVFDALGPIERRMPGGDWHHVDKSAMRAAMSRHLSLPAVDKLARTNTRRSLASRINALAQGRVVHARNGAEYRVRADA